MNTAQKGGITIGIFLNLDNTNFKKAINSKIYVDKTEMIQLTNEIINTEQQYVCISRPRRFGKSMAANMLVAYYSRLKFERIIPKLQNS